jgi:Platelet-activating factor acetylhydrolase, isoform II
MVLDEVIKLNSDANSWLYQKVDMNQVFAAEHSAGGAASFAACEQDQQILKAVNFDGYIKDPINMDNLDRPLLLILSDRETYPRITSFASNWQNSIPKMPNEGAG